MKRTLLFTCIAVVVGFLSLCLLSHLLVSGPTRQGTTITRMKRIESIVVRFVVGHGKIPEDLTMIENDVSRIVDGWGNKISYHVHNDVVYLRSFGGDELQGGEGQNADIRYSFETKNPDGTFITDLQNIFERRGVKVGGE